MDTDSLLEETTREDSKGRQVYVAFVDDKPYHLDHSPVTGREIMDAASIPYEVGLIQILKDGTQKPVGLDEMIELQPGLHFKRAPRFKRG